MKKKRYFYRIVVTYGTIPHMTYARVPSKDSAQKLVATAKGLGYHDARIVEEVEEVYEEDRPAEDVEQVEGPRREREAHPRRPHAKAR